MLTAESIQKELLRHIRAKYKTQKAAAHHWGVSEAFVSASVRGKKNPNEVMLSEIGLCKVIAYAQL